VSETGKSQHVLILRKAAVRFALLLIICSALGVLVERMILQDALLQMRVEAQKEMGSLRISIEGVLNNNTQRVQGLVGYVVDSPDVSQDSFSSVASFLIGKDEGLIRNIALAKDLVVSHIYPTAGNEAALGLDYRKDRIQWPAVQQSIEQNKITLAGPLELAQGGMGLITRYPIYRDNSQGKPDLWGIASLVIDYQRFLEAIQISSYSQIYDIALVGSDAKGMSGPPFWGTMEGMPKAPIDVDVYVPGGKWVIIAAPKGGWPRVSSKVWYIVAASIFVFCIGCAVILGTVRFEVAMVESAQELELSRNDAEWARMQAEQANRAKSLFLANMSHELRTPLNAIIGFSEIMSHELMGKIGNERYKAYAMDIYNSSNHLMEVLSDILDITRIESGDLELNETVIAPDYLVKSALRLISDPMDKKAVKLEVTVPEALPNISVDARLMRQVLVNTIQNAIKYTYPNTTISITAHVPEQGGVAFCVLDHGPGIPSEDLERILEPFIQIRPTAEVTFEGAGLGLPIAKKLMEVHGGSLNIDSVVGQWTRVTLTIPPSRIVT
jgi:signal transduction histidine kinase